MNSYKSRGYVSLLVKKPAKDALNEIARHSESYTDALLRVISFYNENAKKNSNVGFSNQESSNITTSEITPPTSEGSLHDV